MDAESSTAPSSRPPSKRAVRIAVWGCGHGTLDRVYDTIAELERAEADAAPPSTAGPTKRRKVDMLICCGDFQAVRNEHDMECMACPSKYRCMQDFYQYYSGAKKAPVLTVFVGGNHEAANHLQELPYGGWVAPNIFYLGTSGVVRIGGLRIGGVSGIYKRYDYRTGYHEVAPYDDDTARSVFHMREFDLWRLSQLSSPSSAGNALDVFISHDWPEGIYNHGDVRGLLRKKKHFAEEIRAGELGNPETAKLLPLLKPRFWFSAHLHVKFTAIVHHQQHQQNATGGSAASGYGSAAAPSSASSSVPTAPQLSAASPTYFLALDKCLPGRSFLQIIDVQPTTIADTGAGAGSSARDGSEIDISDAGASAAVSKEASSEDGEESPLALEYDPQWLAILRKTHRYTPATKRYDYATAFPHPVTLLPTEADIAEARAAMASALGLPSADSPLVIPHNWVSTVEPYAPPFPGAQYKPARRVAQAHRIGNPQTDALLKGLGGLPHLLTIPWSAEQKQVPEGAASSSSSAASAPPMGGAGQHHHQQRQPYQQHQHQRSGPGLHYQQQHHQHQQQQQQEAFGMGMMMQMPPIVGMPPAGAAPGGFGMMMPVQMPMQMQMPMGMGMGPMGPMGMMPQMTMMMPGTMHPPPQMMMVAMGAPAPSAAPRLVPSSVVGSLIAQHQAGRSGQQQSLAGQKRAAGAFSSSSASGDAGTMAGRDDADDAEGALSFMPAASAAEAAAQAGSAIVAAMPTLPAPAGGATGAPAAAPPAVDPSEISLDDL